MTPREGLVFFWFFWISYAQFWTRMNMTTHAESHFNKESLVKKWRVADLKMISYLFIFYYFFDFECF
jgi:hypothetical protein